MRWRYVAFDAMLAYQQRIEIKYFVDEKERDRERERENQSMHNRIVF